MGGAALGAAVLPPPPPQPTNLSRARKNGGTHRMTLRRETALSDCKSSHPFKNKSFDYAQDIFRFAKNKNLPRKDGRIQIPNSRGDLPPTVAQSLAVS